MKNIFSFAQDRPTHSRAFTLIELLVVIAIIAILTGIVMTSLTGSKAKARDVKRISDIGNLQLAFSLYYDRCKHYPPYGNITPIQILNSEGECPSGINLGTFISVVPIAPSPGIYGYGILEDNNSGLVVDYVMHVTLENYNEVLKDDLDGTVLGVDCGTSGPTERIYCVGPK